MKAARSILRTLEEQGKETPRIDLSGSERAESPDERFAIIEELARGGVGLVYRGRDNDIGRDVALKVLRDDLLANPELIRRFVEEAQIGGQLQHPGIVPVYELGLRSDARPFFAMKLVKGDTLAERLASRARPADDRRALLTAFREVCRTMAYAHARGVIHRDLKPANIMIGGFGEVQVVDWGFAKVLRRGGVDDEALARRSREAVTLIETVRTEEASAESIAGSIMGTPAYMPPEQALGKVEELDEKSDIFSLGAILLEILTGSAPYGGKDGRELVLAAARARLEPALARLETCDADPQLVALCRRCLSPLPKDRPVSAEALADDVAACLTRAEGRAHQARIRAFQAGTEAGEQRRARRFTAVVGSAVVAALLIAVTAFLVVDAGRAQRAQERREAVDAALAEASRHQAAGEWPAALAAVQLAAELGHEGPLVETIRTAAADAARAAERRREEDVLLDALERARAMAGDHYENEEIDAAYRAAVENLWPDGEVDTGRLAASEQAQAFAAAFDAWAYLRRESLEESDWRRVDAWARKIDPEADPLRDAMASEDDALLWDLLQNADPGAIPAARLALLGNVLTDTDRRQEALEFLRKAQHLHPGDFWINTSLAGAAGELEEHDLALRHRFAALAIRPDSLEARHWLGIALKRSGDIQGALEVWQDAYEREPEWSHGLPHIAEALADLDRHDEARAAWDQAVESAPDDYQHHFRRALYLRQRGDFDAAVTAFEKAAELSPDTGTVRNWLGHAYDAANLPEKAEQAFRAAIQLLQGDEKNLAANYTSLSDLLRRRGRFDEALELGEEAWEIVPASTQVMNNLALLYAARDETTKAVELFERALEIEPDSAEVRTNLADVLLDRATAAEPADQAGVAQVIALLREAIDLEPGLAYAHLRLGNVLAVVGEFREAEAELTLAARLSARAFWVHAQARALHGNVLVTQGRYREAIPHLQAAIEIDPGDARPWKTLATAYGRVGDEDATVEALRGAAAIEPGYQLDLGLLLDNLGRFEEAAVELRKALEPGVSGPAALAALHYHLGSVLYRLDRLEDAVPHLEEAIRLRENFPQAWCNLGWCLREMGRWSDAVPKFRKGHELGLATGNWGWPSATWLERTEAMVELRPRLEEVLAGVEVEVTPGEGVILADMLRVRDRIALSIRFYREAFRADPSLAAYGSGHLYMAIRSAAEGGDEHQAQAMLWTRRYVNAVSRFLANNPARVWNETRALRRKAELAPLRERAAQPGEWQRLWAAVDEMNREAKTALELQAAIAERPFAGFVAMTAEAGKPLLVRSIYARSPAEAAGIRPGDVVVKLGDDDITDLPSYRVAVGNFKPGDEVTIVVRRKEELVELHLTLARVGDFSR